MKLKLEIAKRIKFDFDYLENQVFKIGDTKYACIALLVVPSNYNKKSISLINGYIAEFMKYPIADKVKRFEAAIFATPDDGEYTVVILCRANQLINLEEYINESNIAFSVVDYDMP